MDQREFTAGVRYLTTGTYVPGLNGGEKRKMRRMKTMFIYVEEEDRLYFRPKNSTSNDPNDCQKVLVNNGHDPSPLEIIEKAHRGDSYGQHLNVELTHKKISTVWWWPRYLDEIRDYVRHCSECTTGQSSATSASTAQSAITTAVRTSSTPDSIQQPKQQQPQSKRSHAANSSLPTMVPPMRNGNHHQVPKSTLCGECGSVIRNEGNVAVHMRRHLQYRPYHCVQCEYQGYDHDDVKRHSTRSHGGTSTASKVDYRPNVEMETQLQEMIASCKTIGGNGQQQQQQRQHQPMDDESMDYAGDHQRSMDSPKMDQNQQAALMSNLASFYAAAFASSRFPQSSTINGGNSENATSLTCNICNLCVPNDPVPLLRHSKSHVAFDGYLCPYCTSSTNASSSTTTNHHSTTSSSSSGVTYRYLRDLEIHLQQSSVHKSNPTVSKLQTTLERARRLLSDQMTHFVEHAFVDAKIKCQLCSRRIAWRRQSISDHLREHSGYYPFMCSTCRTPFVDLPSLIDHIQNDQHNNLQDENGSADGNQSLIRYCPDVKAEHESHAVFSKCFPTLTSESIENLEPEVLSTQSSVSKRLTKMMSSATTTPINNNSTSMRRLSDSPTPSNSTSPTIGSTGGGGVGVAAGFPNRATLRCQLCQAQISRNMSCLIAHAKVHLAYKPLKCDHCNFRHFAMSKIRRHNARVHGSRPVKVSYHPVPDIGRQIKEMKLQCFGIYGGSSSAAAAAAASASSAAAAVESPTNQDDADDDDLLDADDMKETTKDHSSKQFQVSDILKEMIAASSSGRSPAAANLPMMMMDAAGCSSSTIASGTSPSMVSSLSSLLAERMAAYENGGGGVAQMMPQARGTQTRPDTNAGMDQPIGNGLGKKLCSLCNAYIANNPSSFENHACKHLDYKPYSCHYCQYQSYIRGKVTRHIQQVHSGEQVKISHKPVAGIRERIQSVKMACFPFLAALVNADESVVSAKLRSQLGFDAESNSGSGSKSSKDPTTIVCQLCKSTIQGDTQSVEQHLSETHMPAKIYCCQSCTFRTPQLWKAKQHSAGAHAPDVSKYVACPSGEDDDQEEGGDSSTTTMANDPIQALHVLKAKCFGMKSMDQMKKSGSMLFDMDDDSPLPVEEYDDDEFQDGDAEFDDRSKTESPTTMTLPYLRCRMCSQVVENRLDTIRDHVKKVHGESVSSKMTNFAYQCSYCPRKSTNGELDVKQHILLEHKNVPLKVLHIPIASADDVTTYKNYFPSFSPRSTSTASTSTLAASNNEEIRSNAMAEQASSFFASLIAAATGNVVGRSMEMMGGGIGGNGNHRASPIVNEISNRQQQPTPIPVQQHQQSSSSAPAPPTMVPMAGSSAGSGMLRKLICKLCNSTIADNPKSVGIHVKNHLNYKPYRCPFCRYMSCEQSKARRHVEHVHNSNGDSIEIHAQDNIKERITEMKARCFPNLGHMTLNDVYSNGPTTTTDDAGTTGSASPEYPALANGMNGNGHQQQSNMGGWNNNGSSIFPALKQGGGAVTMVKTTTSNPTRNQQQSPSFQCRICKMTNIRMEDMTGHVQTHLATGLHQQQQQGGGKATSQHKPYQCSYCGVRFGTDEKVCTHMMNVHPTFPPKFVYQPESLIDPDQILSMKKRCFPDFFSNYLNELLLSSNAAQSSDNNLAAVAAMNGLLSMKSSGGFPMDDGSSSSSFLTGANSKIQTPIDGRLTCQICEQAVSMNPNSLDVHVKNHLDFKPHSCPYCDYKSCIAGKVKRHLDNVHKGRAIKVDSFTKSSNNLKQIIADMRTACFPSMEGDYRTKTTLELSMTVENLRVQLKRELIVLQGSDSPGDDDDDGQQPNDTDGVNYGEEIDANERSMVDRRSDGVFSPPASRLGIVINNNEMTSPRTGGGVDGDGNGDMSLIDTSFDEDMMSNCGTDTMSEMGGGGANAALMATTMASAGAYGKLPCMLCGALVADNPSSLGLHVRNHLDYKPFHCLLCDYKSCIQAKVKRHLRNVHKCPTDEMTYNPVANIRAQVTEMKIQCFPREGESMSTGRAPSSFSMRGGEHSSMMSNNNVNHDRSASSAGGGNGNGPNASWATLDQSGNSSAMLLDADEDDEENLMMMEQDDDEEQQQMHGGGGISNFYRRMMGESSSTSKTANSNNNDLEQLAAVFTGLADDDEISASHQVFVECQICGERVNGDERSKTKHLTRHIGDYEYRCQYCDYASFVQAETMKHSSTVHPKQPVRVTRSTASGLKLSAAYERLSEQCFSSRKSKATTIVCALCDTPVSNDADSKLAHAVDRHATRSHRKCSQCPYIHSEENRVKEHMHIEHELELDDGQRADLDDDESRSAQDYLNLCFPATNSIKINFSNGGDSPTGGDSDEVELGDEEFGEEDEEDLLDGEENGNVKKKMGGGEAIGGAKMMPDGPRYICQLCKAPVSMYASSLYVHVKNHMNYKPYACSRCDYKSPVKSKVRRHILNAHRGQPGPMGTIEYTPKLGIEQEVLRWKKRCFPEISSSTSTSSLSNADKVSCRVCHTDISDSPLSKNVHAKNHLDAKPYYCPYCAYKSCMRGETRRHSVRQHPGKTVDVRYRAEDEAKQADVDAMIEKCFVANGQSSIRDHHRDESKIEQLQPKLEPEPEVEPEVEQDDEEEEENEEEVEEEPTPSPPPPPPPAPAPAPAPPAGSAKRKAQTPTAATSPAKKERKSSNTDVEPAQSQRTSSGYNLRTTRSSTSGNDQHHQQPQNRKSTPSSRKDEEHVKLGQAYRDWYCCYCSFKAHSKYVVKQHCINDHPGQPVEVSEIKID